MIVTTRRTTLLALASLAGCMSTGDPSQTDTDDGDTSDPDPHVEPGTPINQTFQFTTGQRPPAGWTFPIRVAFEQHNGEGWIERASFRVDELESATVALLAEERYHVRVEDAAGTRRLLGTYTAIEPDAEATVQISN